MAVASPDAALTGIQPSLETARSLARDHNLIPLHQTFIDDCQTPVSAYLKLRQQPGNWTVTRSAAGARGMQPDDLRAAQSDEAGSRVRGTRGPSFLLESADHGRVGRYSFIGVRPRKVLRWSLGDAGDPYALAAAELERFRPAPVEGLPPFAGGAVGVFAYDLVRTVEPLGEPNPDTIGVPDLALMMTDALVVFDHLKRTVTVLANAHADDDLDASYAAAAQTIADIRWCLSGPLPRPKEPLEAERVAPAFQSNMSREQFESNVSRIIEYIFAGDAYQVVPSQRWSAPVP